MKELECLEEISGSEGSGDLVFFALSTCGWCRKAREFLDGNQLAYRFVYLDKLEGDEQRLVLEEVEKHNPKRSFPTLVIDDDIVVVGFNEQEYEEKVL